MNTPNERPDDFKIITTKDAAAIIGKDKRTLDNWRSLGKGPAYVKLNQRNVGYLYADVVSYIRKHRIEPTG